MKNKTNQNQPKKFLKNLIRMPQKIMLLALMLSPLLANHSYAQSCLTNSIDISTGGAAPVANGGAPAGHTDPYWTVTAISPGIVTAASTATPAFTLVGLTQNADVITSNSAWANGSWISCLNSNYYATDGAGTVYSMTLTRPFYMCLADEIYFNHISVAADNQIVAINVDGPPGTSNIPGVSIPMYGLADPDNFEYFTALLPSSGMYLPCGQHYLNITVINYNQTMPIPINSAGLCVQGTITSLISSLVSNSCAAHTCTVPPISGPLSVCQGSTVTLYDLPGGNWSSDNTSVASIDPTGVVTGFDPGTATITYSFSNDCFSGSVTAIVTVNPLPSSIMGNLLVCAGSGSNLYDAGEPGTWSSDNTGVAIIDPTGAVTGVAAGTSTIIFTNSCGSASAIVTVNPAPILSILYSPVCAPACPGSVLAFTIVAPVGDIGTYWILPSGGSFLMGHDYTMTGTTLDVGVEAVGPVTTLQTEVTDPTTGCLTTQSYSVAVAYPTAYIDPVPGCVGSTFSLNFTGTPGATVYFTDGFTTYNVTLSASAGTATYSGLSVTIPTVYCITQIVGCGGCTVAPAGPCIMVSPLPVVDPITSSPDVCEGSTITVNDATPGGVWSCSSTSIANIDPAAGILTPVPGGPGGTVTISYTVTNSSGCSTTVTCNVAVGEVMTACVKIGTAECNETITFYAATAAGVPIYSGVEITWVGLNSSGGISCTPPPYSGPLPFTQCYWDNVCLGTGTEYIEVTQIEDLATGCIWHVHCRVHLETGLRESGGNTTGSNPNPTKLKDISIIPNPNKGSFTLSGGITNSANAKQINFEIVDMLGQVVYKDAATIENGGINKDITLGENIANGVYLVKIKDDGVSQVIRFTLDR